MARFNEILTGRFNRYLQKILQMKGGPPAAQLATEISPQLVIPDFGVETFVHLGWYRYGLLLNAIAVVGNFSEAQIRNPNGSNTIAVLEKILVGNAAVAASIEVQYGQPGAVDLATVLNGRSLDGRNTRNSSMITSVGSTLGGRQIGTTILATGILTNGTWSFIEVESQQIPITPGDAVQIQSDVANSQVVVGLLWRERALEESELKT